MVSTILGFIVSTRRGLVGLGTVKIKTSLRDSEEKEQYDKEFSSIKQIDWFRLNCVTFLQEAGLCFC